MLLFLKSLKILIRGKLLSKFIRFQFFIIFVAFLEVASIGLIAPMIGIATSPEEYLRSEGILLNLKNFLELEEGIFILYLTLTVFLFIIFSSIASILITWRLSMFSEQIGADMTSRLYSFYVRKEWVEHTRGSTADRLSSILNDAPAVSYMLAEFLTLNSKVVLVLSLTFGLFLIDPYISLSLIGIFSMAYFSIFSWVKRALKSNSVLGAIAYRERLHTFRNSFGAMKEITLLNKKDYFIESFKEKAEKLGKTRGTNLTLSLVPKYFVEFLMFSSIIIFSYYLISSNTSLITILPVFSVFAVAGLKFIPAFQAIYNALASIQGRVQHLENIKNDLDLISKEEDIFENNIELSSDLNKSLEFSDKIELKNIVFRYPDRDKNILDKVSLKIKKNSTIGIAGPSGSGKTTLTDILMCLLTPDSGEILVDGVAVCLKNRVSWQNKITFVPQNLFLTDGTIKENILFGEEPDSVDEEKLKSILDITELVEVISNLPKGIDTHPGDDGIQLSGGQRQRVGIARALYRDSDVIVLDEATSALDGISEKKIMDSLQKIRGSRTIILIAHRLSTLIETDNIILINEGKIEAEGKYEVLLESSNIFRKMDKKSINKES